MREASQQQLLRAQSRALSISVVWMLVAQVICVLLWDAGWLTRPAALVHWLLVGVLPPALALWCMERAAPPE
jgi:hypothetical protein